MIHFECDYMEGCHPAILKRLEELNLEKIPGYGTDEICSQAKEKIRTACSAPEAEVHFLVGGTQTNSTIIAAMLRNYEGVIAADSGHIAIHESGAVEASGHEVITLPGENGKLQAETVRNWLKRFYADETWEHMTIPGMVYISHPTESGTLYTAEELKALRKVCTEYGLYLYLDGARLGYGLAAEDTDVTLPFLAEVCDAFYIGGTKVGAMFGEAVIFPKKGTVSHFFTTMKQRGALLAKGWLLGVQFDTLFTDGLYEKISKNAVTQALYLKEEMIKRGYQMYYPSLTNQQFFVLSAEKRKELEGKVSFSVWKELEEGRAAVRFATSWATTKEQVDLLLALL